MDRSKPGRFDEFYGLLQHVHRIPNVDLLVGYADVHGDLLPINNDDNYHKAISVAAPLLRLFLQRKGEGCCFEVGRWSNFSSLLLKQPYSDIDSFSSLMVITPTAVVHLSISMVRISMYLYSMHKCVSTDNIRGGISCA